MADFDRYAKIRVAIQNKSYLRRKYLVTLFIYVSNKWDFDLSIKDILKKYKRMAGIYTGNTHTNRHLLFSNLSEAIDYMFGYDFLSLRQSWHYET